MMPPDACPCGTSVLHMKGGLGRVYVANGIKCLDPSSLSPLLVSIIIRHSMLAGLLAEHQFGSFLVPDCLDLCLLGFKENLA